MCGRFSNFLGSDLLIQRFEVSDNRLKIQGRESKRYNIAPTQQVAVITRENPVVATEMAWGFVPFYAKELKGQNNPINARDDSLHKNMYKYAFEKRRCLVPATDFYEWKKTDRGKVPHHIYPSDMEIKDKRKAAFAMAGIYSKWKPLDQKDNDEYPVHISFAIITTSPNEFMSRIHDRMPVILSKEGEKQWIDHDTSSAELSQLLKPYEGEMTADVVSKYVNSPANDTENCIVPVRENDVFRDKSQKALDDFF